ncbi:MAG: DUF1275 domain-containing protein [Actinobacteria bacterium]|nr:DUF1275 domain-containing protein [Actinomycetota bacterium]
MSGAPVDESQARGRITERRRHILLIVLALNSGAIDAVGFVALGGAFTSVMTGNMILFGISMSAGARGLMLRSGSAIVLFAVGAFVGARIARRPQADDPVWPRRVTVALSIELLALAAFASIWWSVGNHPAGGTQLLLLALDATALGVQSSAILRFGLSGLSTTYMTGTLTTAVSGLASGRHPRHMLPSAQILIAIIGGAAIELVLVRHAAGMVPLPSLLAVGATVLIATFERFGSPEVAN